MKWDMPKRCGLAALVSVVLSACGGGPQLEPSTPADEVDPASEIGPLLAPVVAGRYALSMSAICSSKERTASGILTLRPVSGVDADADTADQTGDGALLWGQTDLDFSQFLSCLGHSSAPSGEPIHPSVLVEVLRWDGERHHQVLLVSTDTSRPEGAGTGAGVAMWVERVDHGHIGGVWSRWELMGRGEGRWQAELMSGR